MDDPQERRNSLSSEIKRETKYATKYFEDIIQILLKNNIAMLCDKQNLTPQSGYLSRSLIMNLSPLEIIEDDCGTEEGFDIEILNKHHARMLVNRYVKINGKYKLATEELMIDNIGNTLTFRSSITCQTGGFKLCKKCFGNYNIADKKYVGIIAGQVVAERLTQLSIN